MVGTKASVKMIKDLVSIGVVDGIESEIWVTSLAFIPNPSREMITEVKVCEQTKVKVCETMDRYTSNLRTNQSGFN